MFFVQFINFLLIYMFRPFLTLTVEIDGRIDLGHAWEHEFPISTQDTYSQFKTDKHDPHKLASGDEENASILHDDTVLRNLENVVNITSANPLIDIQTKITKEYLKENISKKKTKKRGKKKTKKTESVDSLDHDKINLDDVSPKKIKRKKGATRGIDIEKSKEIKAHKVKEDKKINDFIHHIFKQTLKVFNDIKSKTADKKLKHEISSLKHTFKEKFSKYISETYNHTLRTNLGKQKIILNTIDTSHKLLQRIINNLYKDADKESLRTNSSGVFQKEVDRERDLENKHACKKFRVCRLNDEFSDFLSDIIIVIVLADDGKVKQAADALTEVVKNTDFDNVLNYDLQSKFKIYLDNLEKWDAFMTRAMFLAIKSLIRNKNKPIAIYNNQDNYLANKTIAFQNIINLADERLPKNENVQEWEKIKQDIIDWKEDRNKEPLKIAEHFMKHFKEKVLDKLDYDGKKRFNKYMEVLLSHF